MSDVSSRRVLRSATKAIKCSFRAWASLPTEVELMIFEEIRRQKHPGWGCCAAVCKGWQACLEPRSFHRLRVDESSLEGLGSLSSRTRNLVQYIALDLELFPYDCRSCRLGEGGARQDRNYDMVKNAVLKLFSVLSPWQHTGHLILELSATSPSDSEHWFKTYRSGIQNEHEGDTFQQQGAITGWHDPRHGWVNGLQVDHPPPMALMRIFYPCFPNIFPNSLPWVHAVTGLVVRRQLRQMLPPESLRVVCERLPRLTSMVWEPWRAFMLPLKYRQDKVLASVLEQVLPSHIKTVSIYEDSNDQLEMSLHRYALFAGFINTNPFSSLELVNAFASKSRDLEHLSVSFMIDARQFFDSCLPSSTWLRLQSMTLTSSILAQTAPKNEISALLHTVSSFALQMPQLESLVIWNSKGSEACAVMYQKRRTYRQATLAWRGTWDFKFSQRVIESWAKVASDSYTLRIEKERVFDVINCPGDAIHHLRLPDGVIDPVSLRQIRREDKIDRTVGLLRHQG